MTKFNEAYKLNLNEFTDKKGQLTYLSWAHAWKAMKEIYPDAKYEIIKSDNGLPYFPEQGVGVMVYTKVTANEETHEMWLPVMDYKNKAIMQPTMMDINKAVMRCLTKNLAMFGIGLYIYAGEDLPERDDEAIERDEILSQYKGDPKNYYDDAINYIAGSADVSTLEKRWSMINGWRSSMKRYQFITDAQSQDILNSYKNQKKELEAQSE